MPRSKCNDETAVDVLYLEGPGNIVDSYRNWLERKQDSRITSVTFSGQIFEFCRLRSLKLYAISYCPSADSISGPNATVVNLPRWTVVLPKLGYAITVVIYTLKILRIALRVRPKIILINSGVIGWSCVALLRMTGAKIAPILHNTLWPEGKMPPQLQSVFMRHLTAFAWKNSVALALAVSPAVARQAKMLLPEETPIIEFRPTFPLAAFDAVPPVVPHGRHPFRVMFAGRIEEDKGVFDVLSMANMLKDKNPGLFHFVVCGDGNALPEIRRLARQLGLHNSVEILGQLNRPDLVEQYKRAHVVVVPTRGTFCEGYAMVVAEAVLMLTPVVTSCVVPASELFSEAILLAKTDDAASYAMRIEELRSIKQLYDQLIERAGHYRAAILQNQESFESALHKVAELTAISR